MAISSSDVTSGPYLSNGSTVDFSFSFRVQAYGDVEAEDQVKVVLVAIATGAETVLTRGVSAGQFVVVVNGDQDSSPGGSITTNTVYASGYYIYVRLKPVFTQQTALTSQSGYNGPIHERAFDQFQSQLNDLNDRVRRAPVGSIQVGESFDGQLTGAPEAGQVIVFNEALTGFRSVTNDGASTTVTATGSTTGRLLADRFAEDLSVKDFGAVGDGRIYKGVQITSGTPDLVSTGAAFTADDVGEEIWVELALNGTAPLKTTVAAYVSPTAVTLAANAGATINGATRIVKIGTDDTDAIDDAVAALNANGQNLYFPGGTYLYSGTSGIVLGNGSASAPSTVQNIGLIGEVPSTFDLVSNRVQQGTAIEYFGASVATYMLDVQVARVTIRNLVFNGTRRVQTIWNLKHVFWADINLCGVLYPQGGGIGVRLGAYYDAAGIFVGAGGNVFHQLYVTTAGANDCVALQVGEDAFTAGFDPATTRFDNCYFAVSDDTTATGWTAFNRVPTANTSTCVLLRFTDNISFDGCFCYVSGERRGNGVLVKPPSGSGNAPVFPCQIRMSGCHQVGGIWVDNTDNTWDPDSGDGVVRGLMLVCAHYGDASDPNYDGAAYPPDIAGITGFTDAGEMFGAWDALNDLRQQTPTAYGLALLELADAAALRTAGELGTISTQAANNVAITGGSVTGITDLAIADGGTAAGTARGAAANLGTPRVIYHSAVAVVLTGSTSETLMATIPIAAGEMGPNGYVEIDALWSCTSNGNTKTIRERIAASGSGLTGTIIDSGTPTSVAAQRRLTLISNRNSASSQVSGSTGAAGGTGSISAPSTAAINTANASEIGITAQLADAGDTVTLERVTARLYYAA